MVEHQLPKLGTRVRFPYPAPFDDERQVEMDHRAFCCYVYLGVMASFLFSEGCATPSKQVLKASQPIGSYHEVQKGETVWSIARSYPLKVQEIVEANKLPDPSKLTVGQFLYIPRKNSSRRED